MKGETREEMAGLTKTANRRKVKKLLRGNAIGERLFPRVVVCLKMKEEDCWPRI